MPRLTPRDRGAEVVSLKGFDKGHWTRIVLFDRAGQEDVRDVGSGSKSTPGRIRAARINRYNPDGSGHEIFASGTRIVTGLRWYPGTDTLWAATQERDGLGDDIAPDYFTHVPRAHFTAGRTRTSVLTRNRATKVSVPNW